MSGSNHGALVETGAGLSKDRSESFDDLDARLTLPETTMFVVASSGALWALLYGAFNALFG